MNAIESINSRLEQTEESVCDEEDRPFEIIQLGENKGKRILKM